MSEIIKEHQVKQYDRKFKPIILGNWNAFKPKDDLFDLLESIQTTNVDQNFCHLALPYSLISEAIEKDSAKTIIFGINAMPSLSKGEYAEDIALKMLSQKNTPFVLLDLKEMALISSEPLTEMNEWIKTLSNHGINLFSVLGESQKQFVDDQSFDIISTQIETVLKDVSDVNFEKLTFIYSTPHVSFKGIDNLHETINYSYNLFRQALENCLGEEKSSKIRVMTLSPFFPVGCEELLRTTNSDGFFFPNLAGNSDSFLQTCISFK